MRKIAVFASGTGTNFENIITRRIDGASVELLVTDKKCNALNIAKLNGIESHTFLRKEYESKEAMERAIASLLIERNVDLLVLAGYMRLLSPWFVHRFSGRIINIHPSLLPHYKGKDAIGQAIEDGKRIYGVTVHYVNEGMDEGKIIEQIRVPYEGFDIVELEKKVHECEYELYPKVIAHLCGQGDLQ